MKFLNVMNSKYLFLVETLHMTIYLGCHYICSLVLRQEFRAGIASLQPLIQIGVKKGHANYVV